MLKGPMQWQALRGVVDHVIAQGLEPGARLNEKALAQRLGVSRTPVRAALSHLGAAGVVEHRKGQGFLLVRPLTSMEDAGLGHAGAEDLYDRMLRDILEQRLEPPASQNALVRRYGVRRGEVNATLRRMIREGLAEPAPGQGWTFVRFNTDILRKGYRLRMVLEPNILLEPDYVIDRDALERLKHSHTRMLSGLSEATGWNELFNLDARFHEVLAAGSGNELFVEIIQKQNRIRRLNEFLGYERLDRVRASLDEHQAILESLLDNDREWASFQLRRHLRRSLDQSLSHYQQDLEDFRAGRRRFAPRAPTVR